MKLQYSILLFLALCLWSCGNNELDTIVVDVPVRLILSTDEQPSTTPTYYSPHILDVSKTAEDGVTIRRVMGDPGMSPSFPFPKYLYLFVEITRMNGTTYMETISPPSPTTPNLVDNWKKMSYGGVYKSVGDSVYVYDYTFSFLVQNDCQSAKVYAAMSYVPLTLSTNSPSSAATVENITFSASSVEVQENLQSIYSTPFNYEYDTHYYGYIDNLANHVSTLNLLLYHVAARVDLMWNVAKDNRDEKKGGMRLTYLEAMDLYNGNSYLFRPLANSRDAGESGYNLKLLDNSDGSAIGSQWEGRTYFYSLPFKQTGSYFPVMLRMRQNDDKDADGYCYIRLNMNMSSSSEVFVPWQRCLITFTHPLEYNSASTPKVVNLD